jgi:hypothetical protein
MSAHRELFHVSPHEYQNMFSSILTRQVSSGLHVRASSKVFQKFTLYIIILRAIFIKKYFLYLFAL